MGLSGRTPGTARLAAVFVRMPMIAMVGGHIRGNRARSMAGLFGGSVYFVLHRLLTKTHFHHLVVLCRISLWNESSDQVISSRALWHSQLKFSSGFLRFHGAHDYEYQCFLCEIAQSVDHKRELVFPRESNQSSTSKSLVSPVRYLVRTVGY